MKSDSFKKPAISTNLWKEVFYKQKQAWLRLTSQSMAPLIPEGSRILVKRLENKKIGFGDVVLFTDSDNLIAHRVLGVSPTRNKFLQCGDYALSPSFISIDSVIGKVKKVKAREREIDLESLSGHLLNIVMGIISLGIVPISIIGRKGRKLLSNLKFRIVNK